MSERVEFLVDDVKVGASGDPYHITVLQFGGGPASMGKKSEMWLGLGFLALKKGQKVEVTVYENDVWVKRMRATATGEFVTSHLFNTYINLGGYFGGVKTFPPNMVANHVTPIKAEAEWGSVEQLDLVSEPVIPKPAIEIHTEIEDDPEDRDHDDFDYDGDPREED